MKSTDDLNLPYPEINDPGNGALQLQALAEAVEAALVSQQATLDSGVIRDTLIMRQSVNVLFPPFITYDQVVYDNKGIMAGVALPATPMIQRPGVYLTGCYTAHTQTAGAPAAGSVRGFSVGVTSLRGPGPSDLVTSTWEVVNTNSGVADDSATGVFPIEFYGLSGNAKALINLFDVNSNAGTFNLVAGSYFFYVRLRDVTV